MNLRYVVPALGFVALSATSASAQEIAKGVTLDGYVDVIFTGTTNDTNKDNKAASTTDFSTEGVLMVGWAPTDRLSAKIATRSKGDSQTLEVKDAAGNTVGTTTSDAPLQVVEAYGSVKATEALSVSAGKSYGPFGYYSAYATGVNFVTGVLSTKLYTVNPVGVWATYTVNDKLNATVIVADTYFGNNKTNRASSVSPGVDIVFNPTPELSLDLELAFDPNGSQTPDTQGNAGEVYFAAFNAQYKKDALTAAGEFLYQIVENNGKVLGKDDQSNASFAAFVTYALSGTPIPMAVTGQVSGWMLGDTNGNDTAKSANKGQLVLLTNPLTVSQFGLNYELFYLSEDAGGTAKKVNSYGAAIEGLYIIP